MGTLKIKGKIKLAQFWPNGKSDADTAKINIEDDVNCFLFYINKTTKPKATAVFRDGLVMLPPGKNAKVKTISKFNSYKPIKFKGTNRRYITVRFQGIDAPELHYRFYDPKTLAKFKNNSNFKQANVEYRQHYSETATVFLYDLLSKHSIDGESVDCTFVSENIDNPKDVCDIYGRFVGDILIDDDKINLNHELLKKGLVFPAFYDSMKIIEIKELITIFSKADKSKNVTLGNYEPTLLPFDFKLLFRNKGAVNTAKDKGKVNLPKIYRRQCYYSILSKAGEYKSTFYDYLKSKKEDNLILFENLPAYQQSQNKSNFKNKLHLTQIIIKNKITKKLTDIVFIEGENILVNPTTKKEITKF